MYREALIDQWNNLYSDFAGEYETIKKQENMIASFNRWYEARIHRWNSIAYSEGIILEQEKNPDFSDELKTVLRSFRFTEVEASDAFPKWIGIAAGLIGGGIAGGALALLHWGIARSVLSGGIVFIIIAVGFSKKNADTEKKEAERVKEAYIRQLMDYQKALIAVCDKYKL